MKKTTLSNCRALRLLATALLLLTASVSANAYSFSAKNDDGVTIYYNILSDSEASVTWGGNGSASALYSGVVVIPETVTYSGTTYTVTQISHLAFDVCTSLTGVTIPESVTTIGNAAFRSCRGLTEVTIPNSVTTIDNSAFRSCTGLTSVTIGESVTTIGDYAFEYCSGLTEVNFNAIACTSVWSSSSDCGAFHDCTNISTFNFGDNVTIIPSYLCYKLTGLTGTLTIPNSVTTIGLCAFDDCSGLTSVTIGNSVETIGSYAFAYCSGLTEITIPNSVTSIGSYAFYSCTGLTSVIIGNSVTEIGRYAFGHDAFSGCTGLTRIYSLNPEPPTCGSFVFNNVDKSTCVLYVPIGSKEKYATADQWEEFTSIVEMDMTPVNGIMADGNAEAVGYYTTDGKQIPSLQRGINIIRYSDGTAKKVMVK